MCNTKLIVSPVTHDRSLLIDALISIRDVYWPHQIHQFIDDVIANEKRDLLAFSSDTKPRISYARCEGDWHNSQRRVATTLMRYMNRQYRIADVGDDCLENFCNRIADYVLPFDTGFDIISGESIVEFYRKGSPASCMTGDRADCVRLYADNPDKVQLITFHRDDKPIGRALLWDRQYYDRFYSSCSLACMRFERYCKEMGFESIPHDTTLQLRLPSNDQWPYMDTMRWAKRNEPEEGLVTLSNASFRGAICLDSTGGYFGDECDAVECEHCGDDFDPGDMYTSIEGDTVCSHCIENAYTYIETRDEYCRDDNAVPTTDGDNLFVDDVCCTCEDCDNAIDVDNGVNANHCHNRNGDEVTICDGCLESYELFTCPCCNEEVIL